MNRVQKELLRSGILLMIGLLFALIDWKTWSIDWPTAYAVQYTVGMCFILFAFAHYARKALFPDIDMTSYARKAFDGNLAPAHVFFGMCLVLSVLLYVLSSALLKGSNLG